jgi:RNA polymerase sigma-B factor
MSQSLGESEEVLLEAMEARLAFSAVPLDVPGGDSGTEAVARVLAGSDEGLSAIESSLLIRALLDHLPDRERDIMRLRFFDELTQSEIAARVGLSQMQVSRLIRNSIDKLRALAGS